MGESQEKGPQNECYKLQVIIVTLTQQMLRTN